jgi:Ca2+-binding EF-hand superfamily protein
MLNQTNAMNSIECSDEAFKFFDKDDKGTITPENLVSGFQALGNKLTLDDAKDIIKIIGGGESISLDEFKEIAQVDSMMVYS